jgi:uncharacterized protein (TIGR01777 family)
MRVLISGASGLVGSALVRFLESHDCQVTRLVRNTSRAANEVVWNPMSPISPGLVSGFDAVVHLSGENVAGRWTSAKKRRIRDSRVVSTRNLSQALASAGKKPAVFLCASAIGYYGNRGEEILTEEGLAGTGFLPEVSREWEAATKPASDAGIRTVNLRIGIVLSRNGGALKPMLLPFRFGLGGRIGSGRQWWSWIHIDDLVSAVWHILRSTATHDTPLVEGRVPVPSASSGQALSEVEGSPSGQLSGPVNMTAPNPVTNAEFTRDLASALHRPAMLPIPAFAARLAFGELADEGLLASARVEPTKLLASGFTFLFPNLGAALSDLV